MEVLLERQFGDYCECTGDPGRDDLKELYGICGNALCQLVRHNEKGRLEVKGQVQGHNTYNSLADLEAAESTTPCRRGNYEVQMKGGEQVARQEDMKPDP